VIHWGELMGLLNKMYKAGREHEALEKIRNIMLSGNQGGKSNVWGGGRAKGSEDTRGGSGTW